MLPQSLHAHPVPPQTDSPLPVAESSASPKDSASSATPGMPFARHFHRSKENLAGERTSSASRKSREGSLSGSNADTVDGSVNLAEDDLAAPYPADIRMNPRDRAPQQKLISTMRETHSPPSFTPNQQALRAIVSTPPPEHRDSHSHPESVESGEHNDFQSQTGSEETAATSIHTLPALQAKGLPDPSDRLEPLEEDDGSYDLVAPKEATQAQQYSLETRSEHIFSREHLREIFRDPSYLSKFTNFLGQYRKTSVPTLIYYLEALKAIKAINYANSVSDALEPLDSMEWSYDPPPSAQNQVLEEKARLAFDRLVAEDLPAFVAHTWTNVVSLSISQRITGTLPPHLREASEGLAEVFCLTDPSREDNPIVFASEEFHRTTQYGMGYVIGRNCRFLQGPKTNQNSVRRLRDACLAGKEITEVFLNYRRDGSPFMNLLMVAPLRDSRGHLRYFIGAQVDVSGLAREAADLEALQVLLANGADSEAVRPAAEHKEPIRELCEMLNVAELETVRKAGGRLHHERTLDDDDGSNGSWHRPRLLLKDITPPLQSKPAVDEMDMAGRNLHGKLSGVYSQYLLVRPYPSLRILFTSPSLRVPGILQSPFMNRVGSSDRVREELVSALAEGRGVTAKVRWVTRNDDEGRPRWIHCTPLLGSNGAIGVWMIVLVDEENSRPSRRFRTAPAVPLQIRRQEGDAELYGSRAVPDGNLRSERNHAALLDQRAAPKKGLGHDVAYEQGSGAIHGLRSPNSSSTVNLGARSDNGRGEASLDYGMRWLGRTASLMATVPSDAAPGAGSAQRPVDGPGRAL